MSTMRFRCYYCHRIHTVDDKAVGKRGCCVCGKLMLVPTPGPCQDGNGRGEANLPLALPPEAWPAQKSRAAPRASPPPVPLPLEAQKLPARKGEHDMLWIVEIVLSLVVLAAWLLHQFHTLLPQGSAVHGWVGEGNHLALPAPFWGTTLVTLFAVLLVDGICRLRRRPVRTTGVAAGR